MDCPFCGTYNPEGREKCWRCNKELPRPKEPEKKKDPRKRAQVYLWVAIALFALLSAVQLCGLPQTDSDTQGQTPSGSLTLPPIVTYLSSTLR